MQNKIMTKEIERLFEKYPLYSQEGNMSAKVLLKVFNPYGRGTWYVTEANKTADGDYECFGLVNIFEAELGYFMLSELLNMRVKVFGMPMPLERDTHFVGKTLKEAYEECGEGDRWLAMAEAMAETAEA